MQLGRVVVAGCALLAVLCVGSGVSARMELHEAVAADMTEPEQWLSVNYADAESGAEEQHTPLTEEQRFRQELYLELHPERVVTPAVKIRFLEDGVTLDHDQAQAQAQANADTSEAETETESESETETEADADAEAETESQTETESESDSQDEAEAEAESEAESESESDAEADAEEVAAMRPLANAEADEADADARYNMDSVLHGELPIPAPAPAHTQVAVTLDAARFAQVQDAVALNTAAHQQQQQTALASAQATAMTWSAEKQAALDAFLDADDMDDEDEDEDEEDSEDEGEGEGAAEGEALGAPEMLEMRAEHAHAQHERTRFGRGAAAAMGMPDFARRAEDEEQMMGGEREYDHDADDVSDLMAAQEQVDAQAASHAHAHRSNDMRFARAHAHAAAQAPLPENKDSRLYYARSRRGDKIRRMIRRGEMLYRYAPELMSKVFDPARKVEKPGVSISFGEAMDGPLGPITPPPLGGAAKPKPGSQGPAAFFQMNEHAHVQSQAHAQARDDDAGGSGGGSGGGEEGAKPAAGAKGSKEWIAKKMAEIDSLIKNPYAQAEKYPQMYQHWDNYMYPTRNRPLPPRFYPYPQKGRNPISAFPPAPSLFESTPPQRGPLQTPNALFQNPRGIGGLQPLPAPFAPVGQPSAPSPYASPLGLARFPGGGVAQGGDAANNGVLGPKNHPVFSAHPLPLQKWYQKFLQPAEAPAMTKAPGAKGGDAAEGGEDASGGSE